MTALWVALGAAVGAPLRYLIDHAVQTRHRRRFPLGTFAVNLIGSFLLGGITAAADVLPPALGAAAGVGLCGALTTYSTVSYETLILFEERASMIAVAHLAGSVLAGLATAALGWLTISAVLP